MMVRAHMNARLILKSIPTGFLALSLAVLFLLTVFILVLPTESEAASIVVDADGNGDFTSIQDAINAAEEGDEIRIRSGTYHESIVVNKGMTIFGNGTDSTFLKGGSGDAVLVTASYGIFWGLSVSGTEGTVNGIHLDGAYRFHIGNLSIGNVSGDGIHLNNSHHCEITNVAISNTSIGINLVESDQNVISNTSCINGTDGIILADSDVNSLFNSTFSHNTRNGLSILDSSYFNTIQICSNDFNEVGILIGTTIQTDNVVLHPRFNFFYDFNATNNSLSGILMNDAYWNSFHRGTIMGNDAGVILEGMSMLNTLTQSNVYTNIDAAVNAGAIENESMSTQDNYWGDASGPFHAITNPEGKGDAIIGNVTFTGWNKIPFDFADTTPPPAPTNLTIEGPMYDPGTGLIYIQRGEKYTITVTGPTLADDPGLAGIQFILGSETITIGDLDNSTYSVVWQPLAYPRRTQFIRVKAYDAMGNTAYSETINIYLTNSLAELTIKDIEVSDTTPNSGQLVNISVVIHLDVIFGGPVNNVRVKLFNIDSDGNQKYIGELWYGTVDPDVNRNLGDPSSVNGDAVKSMEWTTPANLAHGASAIFTLRAQVDPDGFVKEIDEMNNEGVTNLTVSAISTGPPDLSIQRDLEASDDHVRFNVIVESNVALVKIEYRFEGSIVWKQVNFQFFTGFYGHRPRYSGEIDINVSSYSSGIYRFEVRAFDGKYFSDSAELFFEVDNPDTEDDTSPYGTILILVVIIVILALFLVQEIIRPERSSPGPTTVGSSETAPERADSQKVIETSASPPQICPHCGASVPAAQGQPSIRTTCPECNEEIVTGNFK